MRYSKRELHIDDIQRRHHIRHQNKLDEYCKNIIKEVDKVILNSLVKLIFNECLNNCIIKYLIF